MAILADSINNNGIYAVRAESDMDGNRIDLVYAKKTEIPSKTSDLTNDSNFVTSSDLATVAQTGSYTDLSNKPDLSVYATTSAMETALADKQNTISDLDTIRAGAAAGATAAQPSDLPSSDELVPSATSGDSGKVLTVDSQGNPSWVTPSAGTVYTPGDGIDITSNVISADVDGTTIGIDASTKKIKSLQTIPTKTSDLQNDSNFVVSSSLATVATSGSYADLSNKPSIPTVDQTYNASSSNAQSGTAVAQAIAAIPSSSYTAGDAIDITNNEISVDYDTNTLDVVGQTVTENVTQQSSSDLFLLPSSVAALLSQQDDTQVTVHIPANTLRYSGIDLTSEPTLLFRFTLYATDSTSETNVSLFSTPLAWENYNDEYALIEGQDIVINFPASVANQWTQSLSSAVAFSICLKKDSLPTWTEYPVEMFGNLSTNPITFTFVDASVTKLAVKNPLPASAQADSGKVLKVNASGNAEWGTVSSGGGVSTVTVPDISYVDSVASVDSTLFTFNDFTVSVKGASQSSMNVLLSHPTLTSAYVVSQYYGTANGSPVAYNNIKTYVPGAKTTHPSVSGAYVYQPQDLTTPISLQTEYDTVLTTAGLPSHFDVEVMYNDGGSAKTFSFKLQIWSDIVEKTAWNTTYALRARVFISAA